MKYLLGLINHSQKLSQQKTKVCRCWQLKVLTIGMQF